ncbi:hypothetical protein RZN05_03625 [Sphingomonas sp. HF-S4]|uniref:Thiazolylpeptide-type bacteriocin n=1 Tax=Sphingomonas agrestis TaxID=3080540 RepID=A0ABU3Y404_9SPHN|nr:hypothetical protein [Sphingomonas sp. HF-S4]MDV3456059.1 hypothetical protein [Sphingomonas sp. HF-S4]
MDTTTEFDLDDLDLDAIEVVATSGYMAIPETGASCCHNGSSCSGSTQTEITPG